jgi:hypothetical protein
MASRRLDDPSSSASKSTAMNPFGPIPSGHGTIPCRNLSRIKLVVGIELQWLSGRYTIRVDDVVVDFCCHFQCQALCFLTAHHLLLQQSKLCCQSSECLFDLDLELGEVVIVTVLVSVAIEVGSMEWDEQFI